MPAKICICENENIIALDIKNCLNRNGYKSVTVLSNSEKLIEQVNSEPPELIVLDVMLNEKMNGFDLAEEILKVHEIPIIFVTGAGSGEYRKSFLQNKKVQFIKKPFDDEVLLTAVSTLINVQGNG